MGIIARWATLAAALGLLVTAGSAEAGTLTVYNDLASFQAATTGLTDVNFNGIVGPTSFQDYPIPPGYTDAATGTNFTAPSADGIFIDVTGRDFYSPTKFSNDFLVLAGAILGTPVVITLPSASAAIGLEFSTFNAQPFTFTLSNGDSYTDTSTPGFGKSAFIGFTDTAPFTSLTITPPGDIPVLFDVKFGPTVVPEPSTLALAGIGAVIGGGVWLRRRRLA